MVEINPVIPVFPIVRPVKIKDDEDRRENKRQQEQQQTEQEPPQDTGPAQHIDEIV
ncbi:MAG: hypothetical protein ACU83N_15595 [Gammaproteobacteria bacterium]